MALITEYSPVSNSLPLLRNVSVPQVFERLIQERLMQALRHEPIESLHVFCEKGKFPLRVGLVVVFRHDPLLFGCRKMKRRDTSPLRGRESPLGFEMPSERRPSQKSSRERNSVMSLLSPSPNRSRAENGRAGSASPHSLLENSRPRKAS